MQSKPAQVNNIRRHLCPRHINHPSDSHLFHGYVSWIAPLRLPRPQGPFPLASALCDVDCAAFCAALLTELPSFAKPQRSVQRCGRGKPMHHLRHDAKACSDAIDAAKKHAHGNAPPAMVMYMCRCTRVCIYIYIYIYLCVRYANVCVYM